MRSAAGCWVICRSTPDTTRLEPLNASYCDDCRWAGTCIPRADLHSLIVCRAAQESEYGWDIFGLMAEAQRQLKRLDGTQSTGAQVMTRTIKKAAGPQTLDR
jgi:hypothetical protein